MSLQHLVGQIQGMITDADLNGLLTLIKQPSVDSLLRVHAGSLLDAVQTLDPATHSLGYLLLLEARARAFPPDQHDTSFFEIAAQFLPLCNADQVRRAPRHLAFICTALRVHGIGLGSPKRCIVALRAAIRALCPEPGAISPIHVDLFLVCILSKCYSAVADLLAEDLISTDPSLTGVTATDVLLYCYYGGMIQTGRRLYAEAMDLYLTAITAPTGVCNAITIAALKKLMLVSLLHTGGLISLPKHTATTVLRAVKSECGAYNELAKVVSAASSTSSVTELANFVASKRDTWVEDGNLGLVNQVIETAAARRVSTLTRTYCTMPLARLAERAGLPDARAAELEVLRMVDRGEIHARLSHRDGGVEFEEFQEKFASDSTAAQLDALIRRCMTLAGAIGEVDHSVTCDRAFIAKTEITKGAAAATALPMPSPSMGEFGEEALETLS